jgi:hypothetical protein
MLANIFFTIKYLSWNRLGIKSDWHNLTQQAGDCSRMPTSWQAKLRKHMWEPAVAADAENFAAIATLLRGNNHYI